MNASSHPINTYRQRWSDVQSENHSCKDEPLTPNFFNRSNSFVS